MWQRIKRVLKSFANFFVSAAEDPELVLEQNIRDLNAQVPRMNESIAMVRANVTLLEKERRRLQDEREDLDGKIRAAIRADREDVAASYALRLEHVERDLVHNEGQVEAARAAYEKALNLKRLFMREKEKRTRHALEAIRAHKRAQWQLKVAHAVEGLEIRGLDATHEDMIRRIEESTALSEARMELALESVDGTSARIEEDAERLRAEDRVQRMKAEMTAGDTPPRLAEAQPKERPDPAEAAHPGKVEVK